MKNFSIRFAQPSEAGLVLDFIKKLATYEKMLDEVVGDEALIYDSVFVKKNAEVIFACEDNEVIGFALFFTISRHLSDAAGSILKTCSYFRRKEGSDMARHY